MQFFRLVHASARAADLGERVTGAGVAVVETATGMSLELDGWEAPAPPQNVTYREVLDERDLLSYHRLTAAYWELPHSDSAAVEELQHARVTGHRYLALVDGSVVGKGYVSLAGPPGVAALFAMSVLPAARDRGVAGGLTALLVQRARDAGCRRVVLHSSEMAQGIYRRVGFVGQCRLPFHATTAIWSHER